MTRLLRYGLASVGPIGSAGAQFLLLLILVRSCPPATFGSFSFMLVSAQLAMNIGSALFCAPVLVLMSSPASDRRDAEIGAIMAGSLALAAAVALLFAVLGRMVGFSVTASLLFTAYTAVAVLRWFGRARAYAAGSAARTVVSDLVYSAVLLVGCAAVYRFRASPLNVACLALLASAAASLLPFGLDYLAAQFVRVRPGNLRGYGAVWRDYSGWSLVGVVTTELTANCHSYLVTLLFGPAAFAPIAATQLMVRPIAITSNALGEFERPQMARGIGERRIDFVLSSLNLFRLALAAIWLATAAAAVALLVYAPRAVFSPHYSMGLLVTGVAMWMIVAGARTLRVPESALLQAAGSFRPLATASTYACLFSIAAVLVLLMVSTPLWSILGILAGELVFTGWTWAMARRWLRGQGAVA